MYVMSRAECFKRRCESMLDAFIARKIFSEHDAVTTQGLVYTPFFLWKVKFKLCYTKCTYTKIILCMNVIEFSDCRFKSGPVAHKSSVPNAKLVFLYSKL